MRFVILLVAIAVVGSSLLLASVGMSLGHDPVLAGGEVFLIDFEEFSAGDVVDNIFVNGLTVTVTVIGGTDEAVIFDSSAPTGGDDDLGTPNETCPGGGPGIGAGGEVGTIGENCTSLGNVLIIQEPGATEPDDNSSGGIILWEFSEGIRVNHFDLLDFEEIGPVSITFFDADGVQLGGAIEPIAFGDNSFERLFPPDVGALEGIFMIVMDLPISGAIGGMEIERVIPPDCEADPLAPGCPTDGVIGDTVFCDDNLNDLFDPGEGLPDITVELTGTITGTTLTDIDGFYLFDNLPLGFHKVTIFNAPVDCDVISVDPDLELDGMAATTLTEVFTEDLTLDFGLVPFGEEVLGEIGDTVFCDENFNDLVDPGEGIPGVTVELTGSVTDTTVTDGEGQYLFTDLVLGFHKVTIFGAPVDCNIISFDRDGILDGMSDTTLTEVFTSDLGLDFGLIPPLVETVTPTPTLTSTSTSTPLITPTETPTDATFTPTPTATPTPTFTPTPTDTVTFTPTPTATDTPVVTDTPTETPTPTSTGTITATPTPTATVDCELIPSDPSCQPTPTPTPSPTPTPNCDDGFNISSGDTITPDPEDPLCLVAPVEATIDGETMVFVEWDVTPEDTVWDEFELNGEVKICLVELIAPSCSVLVEATREKPLNLPDVDEPSIELYLPVR